VRSLIDECPNCGAPVGDSAQCRYCGKAFQPAAAVPAALPAEAEQAEFQVIILKTPGKRMIGVIKVVSEITGLGLKEANDLVDQGSKSGHTLTPAVVKLGLNREEAEGIVKKLRDAGANAQIRRNPGRLRGRWGELVWFDDAGDDPVR
jgi:large subunit ribosomal protein L7/L12